MSDVQMSKSMPSAAPVAHASTVPAKAAAPAASEKPAAPPAIDKPAPFRVDPRQMRKELEDVASQLNRQVERTGTSLGFVVDEVAGRHVVTVRNKENGEVVRQIPGDEVLAVAYNIERLKGIIFSRND